MANTFNAITTGTGGIATAGDSTGAFAFTKDGGTASVTIDANGNVGIGTSSPTNFGSNFKMLAVQGTDYGVIQSISANGSTTLEMMGASGIGYVGTRTNHPLALRTNDTERMRIDTSGNLLFNSGYGSVATAYGCRAWVNFNGVTTTSIRGSGNVTSVTRNGAGDYTINFTTAMPDVNYAVSASSSQNNASQYCTTNVTTLATGSVRVQNSNLAASLVDNANMYIAVFR